MKRLAANTIALEGSPHIEPADYQITRLQSGPLDQSACVTRITLFF